MNSATQQHPDQQGFHGEYKVPGGKLVIADLDVVDARLANVRIAGDFFLEPDEALELIDSALNGMPSSSSAAKLASAIDTAFKAAPFEVQMMGLTTEGIGVAVRRALGHATSWEDHTFEVIPPVKMSPAMHVALDEVICAEVGAGRRGPVFRFWDWDSPLVVIGSFQSVRNEIDEEALDRHGMQVVRRVSGGGAMFMEPGNCITYSLVVPDSLVEGMSFEQSYRFLDDWVLAALAEVGVDAFYVPLNDIASDKGKIGGAAQKRFSNGTVLHHVTSSYDIDADKMLDVLRIGREKLSDKGIKSARKRVDPMRSQTGMTREAIIESFLGTFRSRYDTVESEYTADELARAKELVETKFSSREWTHRVP
ncbi:MAG: biotin/lipoate A/B protein ligase family protein [Actinomycetia bacterium]|nr:biotin/lipoate A/B protein ligase family protein [Actinomycetes bacterium]